MKKDILKKCAEAIVRSDATCVRGIRRMTLGEMAEHAAEACIKAYLKETQSTVAETK